MTTPAELRAQAAENDRRAQESWERSDTDGFLSQWASGITARLQRRQAEILENGGKADFPALFDAETGELVPAKLVETRYGLAWGILADDNPRSRFVAWFNESSARKGATRLRNDRRKGYTVGRVLAPAKAEIMGSGTGLAGAASAYVGVRRLDGGFSRDVEILETEAFYGKDW